MNRNVLREALDEMVRFKTKSEYFINKHDYALKHNHYTDDIFYYGKEAAAVKRASMDLTRALARLRKT